MSILNTVKNMLASGEPADQIAAAIADHEAIAAQSIVDAQVAADAAAADLAERTAQRVITPTMLSNIGLTNGMTPEQVRAKIDAAYPL
jgi:hypothetical protein